MSAKVKPVPDNYPTVSPYLVVDGAAKAIDFYARIFGAKERGRLDAPDGRVAHAELELGSSLIMIADEFHDMGAVGPKTIGGEAITLAIYVENADATVDAAIKAGAKEVRPVQDQFYGDRAGTVEDPFGYKWSVQTHIEDLSMDEIKRRMANARASG
jgi:PhnB protein